MRKAVLIGGPRSGQVVEVVGKPLPEIQFPRQQVLTRMPLSDGSTTVTIATDRYIHHELYYRDHIGNREFLNTYVWEHDIHHDPIPFLLHEFARIADQLVKVKTRLGTYE